MTWFERFINGRARQVSTNARQIAITREGWVFFVLTLGIGAAAINTGNNLLYMVLGLELATIIASGVLSESALVGLELIPMGTRDGHVGDEAVWWFTLAKRAGRLPSLTLTVTPEDGPARGATATVLRLAPGAQASVELRYRPQRRGRFLAREVRVATRFPFGLIEKWRTFAVVQELLVYPAKVALPPAEPRGSRRDGMVPRPSPGRGADLYALRPMTSGDSLAHVHWKKSAQGQGFVIAQREEERDRELHVQVDLRARPDPESLESLEKRLSTASAELLRALDGGQAVALTAGKVKVAPGLGPVQRRQVLGALARAEPEFDTGAAR